MKKIILKMWISFNSLNCLSLPTTVPTSAALSLFLSLLLLFVLTISLFSSSFFQVGPRRGAVVQTDSNTTTKEGRRRRWRRRSDWAKSLFGKRRIGAVKRWPETAKSSYPQKSTMAAFTEADRRKILESLTSEELDTFREAFTVFDKNQDGTITTKVRWNKPDILLLIRGSTLLIMLTLLALS
jgi:hypothetical protein